MNKLSICMFLEKFNITILNSKSFTKLMAAMLFSFEKDCGNKENY